MRKMGPLAIGHPATREHCRICLGPIRAGDEVTLYPMGPADDEDREKAAVGRPHTAVAVVVHWACVPANLREDEP